MAERDSVPTYKVILVGDTETGKTHLLTRYIKGTIPRYPQPNTAAEFVPRIVKLKSQGTAKLQFWDIPGQERYRALITRHYSKSVAFIVVFDLTNASTFEHAQYWVDEVRNQAEPGAAGVLVGNKKDLVDADPAVRAVTSDVAQSLASRNGMHYCELSAVTGTDVNIPFEVLLEEIDHRQELARNH